MDTYKLLVLGKLYPIDQSILDRSGYLNSLFSGRFGGEKIKSFNLEPELEEAFELVYEWLLGQEIEEPNLFPQLVYLASFLDIPDLLDHLIQEMEAGKIPLSILRQVQPLPQIEVPLAEYFLRKVERFALLPPWVQEFFLANQSTSLEQGRPLLLFIRKRIKPKKGKEVKFGPCSGEKRPLEIEAASIPHSLRSGKKVYDYRDKILVCPKKYPRLNLKNNWDVCCSKTGNLDVQFSTLLESFAPVQTDLGLVFVPHPYKKDFIFSRKYNYISRFNALTI